jgi:hypothetical protein
MNPIKSKSPGTFEFTGLLPIFTQSSYKYSVHYSAIANYNRIKLAKKPNIYKLQLKLKNCILIVVCRPATGVISMGYHKKYSSSLPVVFLSLSFGLVMVPRISTAEPREVLGGLSALNTIQVKTPDVMGKFKFESEDNGVPHSSTGGGTRFAEQINFQPPADQGAPQQSVGGSTRGQAVCPQDRNAEFPGQTLTAVLPASNQGLTVSGHPTLLLYVPPTSAGEAQFVLQDDSGPEGVREIYETTFALPKDLTATGGLVTIKIPESLPELEVGKTYTYYATLICSPGDSGGINYDQGLVTRVEVPSQIAQAQNNPGLSSEESLWQQAVLYAESGIWLDTVNSLMALMEYEPSNKALQDQWMSLMRSDVVNLDEAIAKAKIVHLSAQE